MGKLAKNFVYDEESLFINIIGIECKEKNLKLLEEGNNLEIIENLIIKNHYSHTCTKNRFLTFSVWYKGKIEGGLQIGYGIRPKIKGNLDYEKVREFDRMYLTDIPPKYSETIIISMLIKYLKKEYPNIKYLISYADTSAGMTGTIYKAANFKLLQKIKADFYIMPDGTRIHPVTMWHREHTRAWGYLENKYSGIQKAKGYQLKFIYYL